MKTKLIILPPAATVSVIKNLDVHISGTKRATRDTLVSKRPNFLGLLRCVRRGVLDAVY